MFYCLTTQTGSLILKNIHQQIRTVLKSEWYFFLCAKADLSNKDDLIEEIRRLKEIVRLQELKLKVAEEDSKESFAFGFDPQQFKVF